VTVTANPCVANYTAGIQREILKNTTLDVHYTVAGDSMAAKIYF